MDEYTIGRLGRCRPVHYPSVANTVTIPCMSAAVRFTLCFLTRADEVLLLLRNKPPNAGLWNGVGGHIEPGETPRQGILREVAEETNYRVSEVAFRGVLTWSGFEISDGGLYIFTAGVDQLPPPAELPALEGRLAWQPREWLFRGPEVVENIHYFAPHILNGGPALQFHFDYHGHTILSHAVRSLPGWADVDRIFQPLDGIDEK